MKIMYKIGAAAVGAALFLGGSPGSAQSVEEFYSDNDITLMVGAAAGGAADYFARTIAPYITEYMPGNPNIIVQNRPGAGGLVVAAELQANAPRDGTWIATLQRNNFTDPLLSDERIDFDPREVSHLGAVSRVTYVIFTHSPDDPGIETVQDAIDMPLILAVTGAGSANNTYPLMVNELLGANYRLIPGYEGNEEQALAMERGEVDGRAGSYSSSQREQAAWIEEGTLQYILQFGLERHPQMPDIPNVMEAVEDDTTRAILRFMLIPQEIGRPFAAPGGIPEDRLAALRAAFEQAGTDPRFVEEIMSTGADEGFVSGEELQALAEELMGTPPEVVERVQEILAAD